MSGTCCQLVLSLVAMQGALADAAGHAAGSEAAGDPKRSVAFDVGVAYLEADLGVLDLERES